MRKIIKITLMSDLCAGSGYSYAGVIDSDSCFDEYGLPYIPARRIKGCLKEAAEMIGAESEKMFGTWGQDGDTVTAVSIYDARIENYSQIAEALDYTMNQCNAESGDVDKTDVISSDYVTNQFSSVKAQTKIDDNGVAQKNSLRFTRVVNQYNPISDESLVFEADCYINDESVVDELKKCLKALRHMGMDRNRGLGNVKCELVDCDDEHVSVAGKFTGRDKAVLKYTLATDGPVMISVNNDQESEKYINGSTIHGFFANKYIRNYGADENFENMFLKGGLNFSPLYPADKNGSVAYPAPGYICRLKKSKKYVNTAAQWPTGGEEDDVKYGYKNGNQPKKLKGKFISVLDNTDELVLTSTKEVEMDVIYHNRHANQDVKKQLYISQAIKQGQCFSGVISGPADDVIKMADILEKEAITIGKSKTAQYGRCRLISAEMRKAEAPVKKFSKGQRILVSLIADGIFINECGYTVRLQDVRAAIKDRLGIIDNTCDVYSEIETKELNGYYGVWNLRKQSIPVVAAGSSFEFVLAEDCNIDMSERVGERIHEGFGMIDIRLNSGEWKIASAENEGNAVNSVTTDAIKKLLDNYEYDMIKSEIEGRVNSLKASDLNPTTIGKMTLMLQESIFESKGDYNKVRDILQRRLDDIKDDDKQPKAVSFVKKYFDEILTAQQISKLGCRADEMRAYALKQALTMAKYKAKTR